MCVIFFDLDERIVFYFRILAFAERIQVAVFKSVTLSTRVIVNLSDSEKICYFYVYLLRCLMLVRFVRQIFELLDHWLH